MAEFERGSILRRAAMMMWRDDHAGQNDPEDSTVCLLHFHRQVRDRKPLYLYYATGHDWPLAKSLLAYLDSVYREIDECNDE